MSGVLHGILAGLAGLAGAAKDAFFKYVTLLLPGNGTNGAQNNTFIDASTNNFTITRNGNTTQGTFTPYGSNWSNYFDGNGDYLTIPDSTAFTLGSGDWTVEAWFYIGSISSQCIGGQGNSAGNDRSFLLYASNASGFPLVSVFAPTAYNITSSTAITAGTWNHLAAVRNGNTLTLYLNGASVGSTSMTGATVTDMATPMTIGRAGDFAGDHLNGYVSNFRLVKGTAVYTSNFTPSTTPLTAITNTSLLTCQSNRFIDNSTNAFTITPNGDVSVQRFSPFSPTDAYSTSVVGGSGYFDGTGDYLDPASSANLNVGTGQFTVEAWIYPASTATAWQAIYILGPGQTDGMYLNNANLVFYTAGVIVSLGTVTANTWAHVATTRDSSNTLRIFLNGIAASAGTRTDNFNHNSPRIGANLVGTEAFNGYISSLRVVKGTAVYTSNFTPSTTPLAAITNTQLLLNFTNAGIIDNAMLNNLETVGNAQISTAQSKFGGSSMAFDGTGDNLTIQPANAGITLGSGDFTLEMWAYFNNFTNTPTLFDQRPAATNGAYPLLYIDASNQPIWYVSSAARITGSALSTSTWYHIAVARSGTSTKMFVDGVQVGSTYTDSTNYLNGFTAIGSASFAANYYLNGYIDDLRITKGVARYTANFTPPAAAFPTS